MTSMLLALWMGVPAAYLLSCLLLIEKDDHYGPFRSTSRTILFVSTQHSQPVVLWDYIRRIAGVYTVMGDKWLVEETRQQVERFTCPFCLSFWSAFPFSILSALLAFGISLDALIIFIPIHLTIASISQIVYGKLY